MTTLRDRSSPSFTDQVRLLLNRRWILVFAVLFGIFVLLPFAAPLFMHWGWIAAGETIYLIYSFLCHQLPERSFFFFGTKSMYSIGEIQSVWQQTADPMVLRQFIGNPQMGWKVAWSDRMVSMYGSLFLFGLLWWPVRKRLKPLSVFGLVLFLLPMGIDGVTHFLSDLAGLGEGFRYTNTWLAVLTNHIFPSAFYAGDALGSFNSWMRLITGVLFGIGVAWFAFPYFDEVFSYRTWKLSAKGNPQWTDQRF